MTDPTHESESTLDSRLEKLGVTTAPDELEELAAAYPALLAWMRIAQQLADEPAAPGGET